MLKSEYKEPINLMRKIVGLFLLFALFGFLFWQKDKIISNFNYLLASPCDRPITYHLGEIDKGYGLTPEQFLAKVNQANKIWSLVVAKTLFAESANGEITINLIYSERQSMADNLNRLETNLKSGKESLDSSTAEYKRLQADFENKLAAFNQEVASWNSRGGAPEDIFNQLKTQEDELKTEADRLNNLASQLNLSVQQYNLGVGQFNQSAQNYSQAIKEKPEAGLYNGSVPEIDIYLTTSNAELIHTLAHEMGHALGLTHIDDPKSIMYSYTNEVIQPNVQEKMQLQVYCKQKNWETILNSIESNLREKINQAKIAL